MNSLLILVIGLLFVFGMIALLLGRLSRDIAPYPPQHQRTSHFFSPVVFTQYSDRIRAMQDRALDLLEEEPLRGYANLLKRVLAWVGLAPEGHQGPVRNQRVGPQDPFMEVPHPNRL
ncbi:hypothetical protein M407DRAFT_32093 [Tulasnella calospora MUT 4182]|uniref:Uncharacterized protein n=1 Tax=Tulasnella calospora MUT 4182 TaxID=1051891 RepID=A0A0C3Q5D1_9AGAM|nr:hypothetical protein M407DRAFT_32093 [Tulasnella calospora MUT 4182]